MSALVLPQPVTRSRELPGDQLVSFCCEEHLHQLSKDILSFNVKEQLQMVVQNSSEVNKGHARICSGVL